MFAGQPWLAPYVMFNAAMAGYFVGILFFVYQVMLWYKTRNLTLCWVTGVIFASMYVGSTFLESASVPIIFTVLIFELAGIMYSIFWK